jgi:hypothetical protein
MRMAWLLKCSTDQCGQSPLLHLQPICETTIHNLWPLTSWITGPCHLWDISCDKSVKLNEKKFFYYHIIIEMFFQDQLKKQNVYEFLPRNKLNQQLIDYSCSDFNSQLCQLSLNQIYGKSYGIIKTVSVFRISSVQ